MSMPAIERVIPLVGQLPASIREALARRLARTRRPRPDRAGRRGGGGADDMVGAGSEPQPRDLARDPQHRRLSRRDRRRSADADFRARRDHADPARRGVGLAHADPSQLRPRSAAARLLDPLHGDLGGLCKLLAAWRSLAAADRAWRRRRRRAGARARGRVRSARLDLSPRARDHSFRRHHRDIPDRRRPRFARAGRRIDADRGRRRAVRRRRGRRRLDLAGLGVSCRDEREGAAGLAVGHGLSLAGRERARPRACRSSARSPASAAAPRHRWRRTPTTISRKTTRKKRTKRRPRARRARRPRRARRRANPPTSSSCRRFRC